jgi:hypothetical protein
LWNYLHHILFQLYYAFPLFSSCLQPWKALNSYISNCINMLFTRNQEFFKIKLYCRLLQPSYSHSRNFKNIFEEKIKQIFYGVNMPVIIFFFPSNRCQG